MNQVDLAFGQCHTILFFNNYILNIITKSFPILANLDLDRCISSDDSLCHMRNLLFFNSTKFVYANDYLYISDFIV